MLADLSSSPPPSVTEGHQAYAHYYLPCLRRAVGDPSAGEYQLQTIRFSNRDMTDADCEAIATAMRDSFQSFGAERCSCVGIREVNLSGNPAVTNAGVSAVLTSLFFISRRGEPAVDPLDNVEDDQESHLAHQPFSPLHSWHTLDISDLSEPLSAQNQLLVMQLIRSVPALSIVKLPQSPSKWEPSPVVETEPAIDMNSPFAAEALKERQVLQTIRDAPGYSYAVKPYYHQDDYARNALLNTLPSALKRVVLAAGRAHPRLKKGRLHMGLVPEDVERDFPKSFIDKSLECANSLRDVLMYNNSLVLLDVSGSITGDEPIAALASCLCTNSTLREIRLQNCGIGTRGGLALCEALAAGPNKVLLELDLRDNHVNDVVVKAFLTVIQRDITGLGTLHLEGNCITPALITNLYHALMLNTQAPAVKQIVPLLEKNDPKVSKIVLKSDDENLRNGEPLLDDVSLKVLLHSLRNNTSVTWIDVSNNAITDEGALYLSEMMTALPSLRKLVAQFNHISEEGARLLLKTIPRTPNVDKVDVKFQEPPIDEELLELMEKVAGLSNQPKQVRHLGLSLSQNDPDVTSLDLSIPEGGPGGRRCDDDTIETLRVLLLHNTFFEELNVSCNAGRITRKSMPTIALLSLRLTTLRLDANELVDDDVMPLCQALRDRRSRLHTLSLEHNKLTDVVADALNTVLRDENDTLTTVSFTGNVRIGSILRDDIQFHCDLNTHSKTFKDVILAAQKDHDRRLSELDFCYIDRLSTTGTSHGFRKEFGDLSAKLICRALTKNQTTRVLNLCGNRVSDVGAAYFAQLLRDNVTLTHLDLSYNELTDVGLHEILQALKVNTTVKAFVFEGNKSSNEALAKALHQALHNNTITVSSAYTAALNMTGPPLRPASSSTSDAASRVDPRLQQFAIDKMVGSAILEDALVGLKKK